MKLLKKLIIWMLLSVILQCGMLYGLEQTIFKNTSEFETSNLELNKDKKIIVFTHHQPFEELTATDYKHNGKDWDRIDVNAAYVVLDHSLDDIKMALDPEFTKGICFVKLFIVDEIANLDKNDSIYHVPSGDDYIPGMMGMNY